MGAECSTASCKQGTCSADADRMLGYDHRYYQKSECGRPTGWNRGYTTDEKDEYLETPGFPMESQVMHSPQSPLARPPAPEPPAGPVSPTAFAAPKPPAAPEAVALLKDYCPRSSRAAANNPRNSQLSKLVDNMEALPADQNSPAASSADAQQRQSLKHHTVPKVQHLQRSAVPKKMLSPAPKVQLRQHSAAPAVQHFSICSPISSQESAAPKVEDRQYSTVPDLPFTPKAKEGCAAGLTEGLRSGEVSNFGDTMQAAEFCASSTFSTKCASSPEGQSERLSQIHMTPSMTATLSDYSTVSSNGHSFLFESATAVHLNVYKRTWHIHLDRQAGTSLGINVDRHSSAREGLLVTSLTDDSSSIVAAWNRDHPDLALNAGDLIVAVNGHVGKTDVLIQHCCRKFPKSLEVVRPSESFAGGRVGGFRDSVDPLAETPENKSTCYASERSDVSQSHRDQFSYSSTQVVDVPSNELAVSKFETPPATLVKDSTELQLQVEFLSTKDGGKPITVNFTRKPLGMSVAWVSSLPIHVTKVTQGEHAAELGVEVGWTITKVAGTLLTDENVAFVCGGIFSRASA